MKKDGSTGALVFSALLTLTGLATAIFWILFFSHKIKATETEQDEAFERAFPAADTWMICCSLLAAKDLRKFKKEGFFFGASAGSALIFLGLMDILYSLENKKYWPLNLDRAQMLVIHLWTLGLGSATLRYLWKNRDSFFSSQPMPEENT